MTNTDKTSLELSKLKPARDVRLENRIISIIESHTSGDMKDEIRTIACSSKCLSKSIMMAFHEELEASL